jgi:hypothetical protein
MEREEGERMRGRRRLEVFWFINFKKYTESVSSGVLKSCKIVIARFQYDELCGRSVNSDNCNGMDPINLKKVGNRRRSRLTFPSNWIRSFI